jgi:hypothetical protein
MRRWLALAGVVASCGCGGDTPTIPSPIFVGNYTFVVEASPICDMPAERFSWNLVATEAGGDELAGTASYRMTLPDGDPTVSLNLAYSQRGGNRGSTGDSVFNVTINVQNVQVGPQLKLNISGPSRGTPSIAGNGLGQVTNGLINGTLRLTAPGTPNPVEVGRCTAGDHPFTLTPR